MSIEIDLRHSQLWRRYSLFTSVFFDYHIYANSHLLLSSDVRSNYTTFIFGVQHYIPCIQKSRDHGSYLQGYR